MLSNLAVTSDEKDCERHWYSDDYFDLIIWHDADGAIHGFQLCYDTNYDERALTWTRNDGFQHTAVDSGESSPLANRTPILIANGAFPTEEVRSEFLARGKTLPTKIFELVLARIAEYEKQVRT
jgi:hypothetical protein